MQQKRHSMKRPHHKTTTKEQYSHGQHQYQLQEEAEEEEELGVICTAAKHLDKSIIYDKLLNHGQLQKYRRAGKDALVPSSILALRLLRKVSHSLKITTTTNTTTAATITRHFRGGKKRKQKSIYTEDDNDDDKEEKMEDTVECEALILRAMLLLPSCSSSPWDAIKIFVKILLDRKEGSEGATHSRSIIGQKTVIDIKVFLSCIFQKGGNNNKNEDDDDKRCIHSLMNSIQDIGNDIAVGIYTRDTLPKSSIAHLFQVLVSLYNASKRIDDNGIFLNDATKSLSEIILDDILNHDGCVVAVHVDGSVQPRLFLILSLALSVACHQLRRDLKPYHWCSLQQAIVKYLIGPQILMDSVLDSSETCMECVKELSSSIALQILLDAPRRNIPSSILWARWVTILLYMYQWSSMTFDKEHFTILENQIVTLLSSLQPWGVLQFLKVSRDAGTDDAFHIVEDMPSLKEWALLHVILSTFQARVYVGEGMVRNLDLGKTPHVDVDVKHACVEALMDILHDNSCGSKQVIGKCCPEEKTTEINYVDLFGIGCDLNRFFSFFEKCKLVIKERKKQDFSWDRMELWNEVAYYCIDSTPSVCNGRNIEKGFELSSAILAAVYAELPIGHQPGFLQGIMDRLSRKSTTEYDRMRSAWCSWTFMTILSGMPVSSMIQQEDDSNELSCEFSTLLGILDVERNSLPMKVASHVFSPVLSETDGRARILQFFKRESVPPSKSPFLNVHTKLTIDCLLLLIGNDVQNSHVPQWETLVAMQIISDEIFGRDNGILFDARRVHTLRKLVSACRSGVLCRVALERIRMASLNRLIPFLKKVNNSHSEISPSLMYCDAACHELNLLIQLFLAACGALLSFEVDAFDVLVRNEFKSGNNFLSAISLRDGSLQGNGSTELSLVIKSLNALIHFEMAQHNTPSDESSAGDDWEALLHVEMTFWHKWQNMQVRPQWLQNPNDPIIVDTRERIEGENALQSLRTDLAFPTAHFLLLLGHHSNHLGHQSQLCLSITANNLLSKSQDFIIHDTCETMVDPHYMCVVVESYVQHTNEFLYKEKERCKNLSSETSDEYLESISRAIQTVGKKLNSLQLNYVKSTSFHLYEALVDLVITLQNLREGLVGGPSELILHQIIDSVLNMLNIISEKILTITWNVSALNIYCRIHLKLLSTLSLQLSDEVSKDPNSLCEEKTEILDNLLASMLIFLRASPFGERFATHNMLDWMRAVETAFQNCWNVIECCTSRKRKAFQIFLNITLVQLPKILRNVNRMALYSGTPCKMSPRHIHDTFCINFDQGDAKKQSLQGDNSFKMRLSWICTSDVKLHLCGLSMCLLNFESLWTESEFIIQEMMMGFIPRAINLNESNSLTFAKDHVLDFCHSLSSVMYLLKLPRGDLSIKAMDSIFSLLSKILSTLQNSVECLTSHLDEWSPSGEVEVMTERIDVSVFEAILCIASWMKVDCTNNTTSSSATMINVIKAWCKEINIQKEPIRKQTSITLGRIQTLETALCTFRKEAKNNNRNENRLLYNVVNSLLEHKENQGSTSNLVSFLCDYIDQSELIVEPSVRPKTTSRSTQKRATNRNSTKNTSSRNTVVNEWLELDRNLDDNSSLGGYEDLEDFILPG